MYKISILFILMFIVIERIYSRNKKFYNLKVIFTLFLVDRVFEKLKENLPEYYINLINKNDFLSLILSISLCGIITYRLFNNYLKNKIRNQKLEYICLFLIFSILIYIFNFIFRVVLI